MSATKVISISDSNFNSEVVNSNIPVMVDFWAEWCGPCKIVAPLIQELAEEFNGVFKFTKLDVDSNPQSAADYGIRSIPTLLIFKNGKPVDQIVGALPKSTIKAHIQEAI